MVILGTQYAGEMKKGIFSVMHYLMPKRGILSLHTGCNVGAQEDVTLFFGLSGVPLMHRFDMISPCGLWVDDGICLNMVAGIAAGLSQAQGCTLREAC